MPAPRHCIWGSELSPFSLKLRALCDYAGLRYAWLPADGRRLRNTQLAWRLERAKRSGAITRYPRLSALDEYPLMPFLIEDGRRFSYDSSALAQWLDVAHPAPHGPLVPTDPLLRFATQLIDEAFDEFGLYLVHHNRWVVSATTNDAGIRLAREFDRLLPPGVQSAFAQRFARRQVRRLPYLFSVAPPGFTQPGLALTLTPPSRPGFPATHALLDAAWEDYVDAMEAVLSHQPYLFGARFTIADASAYGELGMNLKDPTAAARLRARAPQTYRWLEHIRDGGHAGSGGALALSDRLAPLLAIIGRTFVPLMRQNAQAYEGARQAGETLFNEPAFDRGRALYDGELLGSPFRSVAKTFQVRVWRDVTAAWQQLAPEARSRIAPLTGDAAAFA